MTSIGLSMLSVVLLSMMIFYSWPFLLPASKHFSILELVWPNMIKHQSYRAVPLRHSLIFSTQSASYTLPRHKGDSLGVGSHILHPVGWTVCSCQSTRHPSPVHHCPRPTLSISPPTLGHKSWFDPDSSMVPSSSSPVLSTYHLWPLNASWGSYCTCCSRCRACADSGSGTLVFW